MLVYLGFVLFTVRYNIFEIDTCIHVCCANKLCVSRLKEFLILTSLNKVKIFIGSKVAVLFLVVNGPLMNYTSVPAII